MRRPPGSTLERFEKEGFSFQIEMADVGWLVRIVCPNGVKVEHHDFQTQAGAKMWVRVNARSWIQLFSGQTS